MIFRSASKWMLVMVLSMLFLASVEAQSRRGGRGGWQRQGMIRRFLPLEQTIGYLAFDEKISLKDDQLLKIRKGLLPLHGKRTKLAGSLRDGDREQVMQDVRGLNREMREGILAVLDPRQTELIKAYWQRQHEMMERFRGGGGRRGRGGGGGGGASL